MKVSNHNPSSFIFLRINKSNRNQTAIVVFKTNFDKILQSITHKCYYFLLFESEFRIITADAVSACSIFDLFRLYKVCYLFKIVEITDTKMTFPEIFCTSTDEIWRFLI